MNIGPYVRLVVRRNPYKILLGGFDSHTVHMIMNCKQCNADFEPRTYNQLYCCEQCYKKAKWTRSEKRKRETKPYELICEVCETVFNAARYNIRTCSKKCSIELQSSKTRKFLDIPSCLEDASRKLDKNLGYVRVYVPMHPEANTWGYAYEHRVVAEQIVGRRLFSNEIVHHKNGKRWDNRPENLEIMDKNNHAKLHGQREEDKDI